MPNQYAKVKNTVKGEDGIQDQPTNAYRYIDEFLEDAIKSSNLYGEQDSDYEPWNSQHCIKTSISRFCIIIFPWGKYKYKLLPTDIKIGPDAFQNVMSKLSQDMKYVKSCLSGMLIVSTTI
jgi:hypothetical protein